jgi:hypothetical protein
MYFEKGEKLSQNVWDHFKRWDRAADSDVKFTAFEYLTDTLLGKELGCTTRTYLHIRPMEAALKFIDTKLGPSNQERLKKELLDTGKCSDLSPFIPGVTPTH